MLKVQNIITEDCLVKQYDLDVGNVFFYENYLVIEVAEGTCFGFNTAKELIRLVRRHFKKKPFGYISHRINSYSVVPTDYLTLKETFPNLSAFAVVAYDELQLLNIDIENIFFSGNITYFDNLNHASNWVSEKLSLLLTRVYFTSINYNESFSYLPIDYKESHILCNIGYRYSEYLPLILIINNWYSNVQ